MSGKIKASGNIQSMLNFNNNLTSYCYYSMFSNCTSLTTAPALPATTLATLCYYYMFNNCTSLNEITVHFNSWIDGTTNEWLYNVSPSGTFNAPIVLSDIRGTSNIPTNWTLQRL